MNNDTTISIKDLVLLLWNHIWALLLSLVIGAGAAFAYTYFAIAPLYSSHISMYVQTYTGITDSRGDAYNDISKSKQLINTYIQVLKDDAVMESVGEVLCKQFDAETINSSFSCHDGKIRPSSLASCISISTVTDTSAIKIVSTTKNAELSAAVCNELCKQANYFTDSAIGVGEIKSIDTAKVYSTPVGPNIKKNTALGGIALMLLTAFIFFLIDFFDTTIRTPEVISKKYKKAILGEIDDLMISKNKKNSDERITLLDNQVSFNVIESYKALRLNISFALSTSDKKAFVISSSNPSEGKSTTAANIAITMADEGQRVILIDADMRKPTIHQIFNLKNEAGLSSVLSRMKKADDCIQSSGLPTLSVLTSGPIPPNPSELLASRQTAALLEELSEKFDIIIIDSPPVNVVSDALNLSPYVAGLLTVIRSGYTTEDDIKSLVEKTKLAHIELLGFVLTRVKRKSGGYGKYGKYGNHYYKDYSYGTTPSTPVFSTEEQNIPAAEETAETAPAAEETAETAPAAEETAETAPAAEETAETAPAAEETAETAPAAEETTETAPAAEETAETAPAAEETAETAPAEETAEEAVEAAEEKTSGSGFFKKKNKKGNK